jgi:four helix bundle protein
MMKGANDIHERAFQFACRIVNVHQALAKRSSTIRPVLSQLLRSGTGIASNLQEAEAGQTKADFIAKCRISLKEARETHYWLRLLIATKLVGEHRLTPLATEANEIVAIITTIVKNASTSKSR